MFGNQIDLLKEGLAVEALRRDVYAQNIANLNTPGYKRQEVSFGDQMAAVRSRLPLQRTDPRHLRGSGAKAAPTVVTVADRSMRVDGNNVDIDREIAALTGTALRYSAYVELIGRELQTLRNVIQGR